MKLNGRLLIVVLLGWLCPLGMAHLIGQVKETDVIRFLESKKTFKVEQLCNAALTEVSTALLLKGKLLFNLEENSWTNPVKERYFFGSGKSLATYASALDIIQSEAFLKSLRTGFVLKSVDDACKFQSVLGFFDDHQRSGGFFQKDHSWYFIRNQFFERIEHFKVETDAKGTITAIHYASSMDTEVPADLSGKGDQSGRKADGRYPVEKADSLKLLQQMNQLVNYRFEVNKPEQEAITKVSGASLFEGQLIFTVQEGEFAYEQSRDFNVIAYNGEYEVVTSKQGILKGHLFSQSMRKQPLRSNTNAVELVNAFSSWHPCSISDPQPEHQDNIWFLPWEQAEEVASGYMIKVNDKGLIQYIDYASFSPSDILKFKMKDPDFKVDYNFSLTTPMETPVNLTVGNNLPVSIQFNEDAVNAVGGWILTRFNGKPVGMKAGTSMEAPFMDEVPDKVLTQGQHLLEYLLLPPGKSTEHPLGIIKIEINVN